MSDTEKENSFGTVLVFVEMAEDREILREIWDGRIPVCFRLAADEVYTLQHPEPFYVMVSRSSYFPIVTDKVQKHFSPHVREEHQNSEMWLEYDGQPLKWHYPVGLLFDFYGADSSLPWNLTVHFQNFPEEEVIHCPSRIAVQSHFMATVKEASALKHRNQLVQSMHPKDHKELWQGLMNDKFDQFWAVNKKLMENPGEVCFKYIPFRLYQPNKPLIQNLIRPVHESGEKMTLYNLLEWILPHTMQDIDLWQILMYTHFSVYTDILNAMQDTNTAFSEQPLSVDKEEHVRTLLEQSHQRVPLGVGYTKSVQILFDQPMCTHRNASDSSLSFES